MNNKILAKIGLMTICSILFLNTALAQKTDDKNQEKKSEPEKSKQTDTGIWLYDETTGKFIESAGVSIHENLREKYSNLIIHVTPEVAVVFSSKIHGIAASRPDENGIRQAFFYLNDESLKLKPLVSPPFLIRQELLEQISDEEHGFEVTPLQGSILIPPPEKSEDKTIKARLNHEKYSPTDYHPYT